MKSPAMSNEKELLLQLRDGDTTAFSQIFTTYYQRICFFAEKFVGQDFAEDIAEDVFVKLLQNKLLFNDLTHLKAYLYRSVKHSCLDLLKVKARENDRHTIYSENYSENQPSYLSQIMYTEAISILYRAIERLPTQMAKIMEMTYLEGMSNQQAADELGVSLNTIKTQKQRGLIKLRQILPKEQFGILLIFFFF